MPPMHLKIDLHIHSKYSDGAGTPEDILEHARKKGVDGLAITDHNTLEGYFRARELDGDLLVVPGFEVVTEAGHVLVLGLNELPPKVETIGYYDLVNWARELGGLTVLAHPAVSRFHLDRWLRIRPDAVEVMNASYPLRFFVGRGLRLCERLGVPSVGGSDAHSPRAVGDAYTVVEVRDASLDDVLNAIRGGDVWYEGELSPFGSRLRIGLDYVKNML